MKQIFSFVFLFIFSLQMTWAQAPNSLNYQGVARNAQGNPIAGQPVKLRLSVLNGSTAGPVLYSETRTVTTNNFGLFTIAIGSIGAQNSTGNFTEIAWAGSDKFLKVEMEVAGSFSHLGTTQLLSVPYALHSTKSSGLIWPQHVSTSYDGALLKLTNLSKETVGSVATFSSNGDFATVSVKNEYNGDGLQAQSVNGLGIYGSSSTQDGVRGFSTDAYGVAGIGHKAGGVMGESNTGKGVHGFSKSGHGVYGESEFIGVFGKSSIADGVRGESNSGVAIVGISGTNAGVYGISTSSYGVYGTSSTGTGVTGSSNNGTGVSASSSNGLALDVTGNVRIHGGNTSPGAGKVLTSDAEGNATWKDVSKQQKIAFKVVNVAGNGLNVLAPEKHTKAHFANERYDYGNNYNPVTGTPSSTFIAPKNGLYHFGATIEWNTWGIISTAALIRVRNGAATTFVKHTSISNNDIPSYFKLWANSNHVSSDIDLIAGDQVYVQVWWVKLEDAPNAVLGPNSFFSGHLVYAD